MIVDIATSMRGFAATRSIRYCDIDAAKELPRMTIVTRGQWRARYSAAWPAEFPRPRITTGLPAQSPAIPAGAWLAKLDADPVSGGLSADSRFSRMARLSAGC